MDLSSKIVIKVLFMNEIKIFFINEDEEFIEIIKNIKRLFEDIKSYDEISVKYLDDGIFFSHILILSFFIIFK
jgi:hypothetical protein